MKMYTEPNNEEIKTQVNLNNKSKQNEIKLKGEILWLLILFYLIVITFIVGFLISNTRFC